MKSTLATLALLLAQACAVAAALQPIPGTKVQLEIPSGFEMAQSFTGIIKKDEAASMMVTEMPTSPERFLEGIAKEKLAERGMILIERSQTTIAGRKALIFHVRQYAGTTPFLKWMAVFGADDRTVFLVASCPEAVASSTGKYLQMAMFDAQWNPTMEIGLFDGLPFVISASGEFVPQQRVSTLVLIGRKTEFATPGSTKPVMIAGSVPSPTLTPENAFTASRQFVLQTNRLVDLAFGKERKVKIAGLDAYEITGTATNKSDGKLIAFYQALIPNPPESVVIYGQAGVEDYPRHLPSFKAVAETLQLKPPTTVPRQGE